METLEADCRSSRCAFARTVNTRLSCTAFASDGAASVTTTSVREGADACATGAALSAAVPASAINTPRLRPRMVRGSPRARGYNGFPRGCGGIGRRARFRSVWGQPRGGSSPLIRIVESRDPCTSALGVVAVEGRSEPLVGPLQPAREDVLDLNDAGSHARNRCQPTRAAWKLRAARSGRQLERDLSRLGDAASSAAQLWKQSGLDEQLIPTTSNAPRMEHRPGHTAAVRGELQRHTIGAADKAD